MTTDPGPPVPPQRLPHGLTVEHLQAWVASVEALPDWERVAACRDELAACVALAGYVRALRCHYVACMFGAADADGKPTHTMRAIAAAAGVTDSYVSRQVSGLGLPPRRGGDGAT